MPRRLSAGGGERAPESTGSPESNPSISIVAGTTNEFSSMHTIASCSFSRTKCRSDGVIGLGWRSGPTSVSFTLYNNNH